MYSTKVLCQYISAHINHFKLAAKSQLLLQLSQQLGRRLLTVTLGVVLGPEPEILTSILKSASGGPAKLVGSTVGIGSQVKDITITTGSNLVSKVTTDSSGESLDHLVDGRALTSTQVPGTNTGVVGAQVVEGLQVTISQVENVDVVTDGSAVVGVVVITEDEQLLALAGGNLGEEGQQVVGDTLGVLTHDTGGVSTGGVEVTEESTIPLLGLSLVAGLDGVVALGVDCVGDGELNGELGVTVGVGRAQRALLGDGNHVGETGGITIDGGGAGEDNVGDIVLDHGTQEVDGAVDVDVVVVEGLLARLANSLN